MLRSCFGRSRRDHPWNPNIMRSHGSAMIAKCGFLEKNNCRNTHAAACTSNRSAGSVTLLGSGSGTSTIGPRAEQRAWPSTSCPGRGRSVPVCMRACVFRENSRSGTWVTEIIDFLKGKRLRRLHAHSQQGLGPPGGRGPAAARAPTLAPLQCKRCPGCGANADFLECEFCGAWMCVECLGEHRWLNHFQAERLREHIRREQCPYGSHFSTP